jgi:hypothetical protein
VLRRRSGDRQLHCNVVGIVGAVHRNTAVCLLSWRRPGTPQCGRSSCSITCCCTGAKPQRFVLFFFKSLCRVLRTEQGRTVVCLCELAAATGSVYRQPCGGCGRSINNSSCISHHAYSTCSKAYFAGTQATPLDLIDLSWRVHLFNEFILIPCEMLSYWVGNAARCYPTQCVQSLPVGGVTLGGLCPVCFLRRHSLRR